MVTTTRDGDVLTVTLDRPEQRNAVRRKDLAAIVDALANATAPVVALRGEGSAFCAGADLDVVRSLAGPEAARELAAAGQRTARALASYDGATVACIDGAARGGGVDLALACDVRICTPEATIAESGVEHGLFGAWGGTRRLPAVVGPSMAMDLALTGRVLDADAAMRTGFVSRVTEDPLAVARKIGAKDADAVAAIAARQRAAIRGDWRASDERDAFAALVAGGFGESS